MSAQDAVLCRASCAGLTDRIALGTYVWIVVIEKAFKANLSANVIKSQVSIAVTKIAGVYYRAGAVGTVLVAFYAVSQRIS